MLNYPVKNFKHGQINNIEAQSIPDGAASDALNFLTKGDKIELRRGSIVKGAEVAGSGSVTGLIVAHKADGTEVTYEKVGAKLNYLNPSTSLWEEVGTNVFGAAAAGDDASWAEYQTLAGAQLWICSPNSPVLLKIMTANPTDYADQYNSAKNYLGRLSIKLNRMMMWARTADKTGLYGSYIDNQIFTTVTAEAIGGAGARRTGNLAFKAGGAKRTCFAVSFTDGTETFTDDYNGVLTGSAGGTGTINYTTGAYDITFAVAPGAPVTSTYQWEDATNKGIADFTKSGTRLAGEGFVFRQDDGGDLKNIFSYGDSEYCLHEKKAWVLTITATDTNATNLIYREKVGIPNWRAAVATGNGIYYIDTSDPGKPRFRLLTLAAGSDRVIPKDVTLDLKLEDYNFDECWMEEWNDYIVFTGKTLDASRDNRTFLYNKIWGSIDVVDYYLRCMAIRSGVLWGGESISSNVVELFSGFDDDDSPISGYFIGNISNFGAIGLAERLKKTRKFKVEGEIGPTQGFEIYYNTDRGGFVLIGTISGSGSYVDTGQAVYVGGPTVGSKEVGGGSENSGVEAYHYEREFHINVDKFENRQIKFVPTGIGYFSISLYEDRDIRPRGYKAPSKYR